MRRELSSARPETAGHTGPDAANHPNFRTLATRKVVIGTAAFAALAAAAGLGAAAPAMTAAADSTSAPAAAKAPAAKAAAAQGNAHSAAQTAAAAAAKAAAASNDLNLEDLMDRTVAAGLGSAPTGGAWSPWGASFSVSGGKAHMANIQPGVSARATLEGVQVRDEGVSVTFSVPTLPTGGTGSFFGVLLRRQANGDAVYARVKVAPGGVATVAMKQQVGTTATSIGRDFPLPARLVAGKAYVLDTAITGGANASTAVRVYADGASTPAWQVSGQASLPTAMATRGSVGVYGYASGSAGPFSVDIDGIRGRDATPTTGTPTTTPTTPTSNPTTPTSTPTTPSSNPTTSTPTSSAPGTPSGTGSVDGGIGFASGAPSTDAPTQPPTTPPTTPVTTPPSSSTPPPPPVGKPGPDNTGVRPGSHLTVVTPAGGSLRPTAGQVLENLDIRGGVTVSVPNVTIRNCIIRGKTPDATRFAPTPLVYAQDATNLQIIDTEIAPSVTSINNQNSITGGGFTLTRVNLHGGVDGMAITNDNVTVRDSWIHDTSYFASSPFQGGGATHNDAIAVQRGHNILITGNTFENTTQSVLQTNPLTQDAIANMVISGNWVDGGSCSINIAAQQFPTMPSVTILGNRFGTHQRIAGCAIIANQARTPLVLSGNVWDLSGTPVAVSRGA